MVYLKLRFRYQKIVFIFVNYILLRRLKLELSSLVYLKLESDIKTNNNNCKINVKIKYTNVIVN